MNVPPSPVIPSMMPAVIPSVIAGTSEVSDQPSIASWEMWDTIRSVCDYNTRLSLSEFIVLSSVCSLPTSVLSLLHLPHPLHRFTYTTPSRPR